MLKSNKIFLYNIRFSKPLVTTWFKFSDLKFKAIYKYLFGTFPSDINEETISKIRNKLKNSAKLRTGTSSVLLLFDMIGNSIIATIGRKLDKKVPITKLTSLIPNNKHKKCIYVLKHELKFPFYHFAAAIGGAFNEESSKYVAVKLGILKEYLAWFISGEIYAYNTNLFKQAKTLYKDYKIELKHIFGINLPELEFPVYNDDVYITTLKREYVSRTVVSGSHVIEGILHKLGFHGSAIMLHFLYNSLTLIPLRGLYGIISITLIP